MKITNLEVFRMSSAARDEGANWIFIRIETAFSGNVPSAWCKYPLALENLKRLFGAVARRDEIYEEAMKELEKSVESAGTVDRMASSVGGRLSRFSKSYYRLTAHRFLSNFLFQSIDLPATESLFHD